MEQNLIYISIFTIAVLTIILAMNFKKYNNLKNKYKIMYSGALRNKQIIDEKNKQIKELEDEKTKNIQLQSNIDDQKLFISSLNERVQRAEADAEEYFKRWNELKEDNRLLADQRDELETRLSRKGLGKKGTKKNVYYCDFGSGKDITVSEIIEAIDISSIDDMSDYYGCEFIAKTQTDEEISGFVFKANVPESRGVFLLVSKSFDYYWYVKNGDEDAKYVSEEFLDAGYYAFFSSLLDCRNYKQFNIIKRG